MVTGIRQLKNNLSHYIRRIEAGGRVSVTAHGRIVAQLVPPDGRAGGRGGSRFDELLASGIVHAPVETGDPLKDWPALALPPGTARSLIDIDRGET